MISANLPLTYRTTYLLSSQRTIAHRPDLFIYHAAPKFISPRIKPSTAVLPGAGLYRFPSFYLPPLPSPPLTSTPTRPRVIAGRAPPTATSPHAHTYHMSSTATSLHAYDTTCCQRLLLVYSPGAWWAGVPSAPTCSASIGCLGHDISQLHLRRRCENTI